MDSRAARLRVVAVIGVVGLLAGLAFLPGGAAAEKDSTVKRAAEGRLRPAVLTTPAGVTRTMPSLSGGTITTAAETLANRQAEDARGEDDDSRVGRLLRHESRRGQPFAAVSRSCDGHTTDSCLADVGGVRLAGRGS